MVLDPVLVSISIRDSLLDPVSGTANAIFLFSSSIRYSSSGDDSGCKILSLYVLYWLGFPLNVPLDASLGLVFTSRLVTSMLDNQFNTRHGLDSFRLMAYQSFHLYRQLCRLRLVNQSFTWLLYRFNPRSRLDDEASSTSRWWVTSSFLFFYRLILLSFLLPPIQPSSSLVALVFLVFVLLLLLLMLLLLSPSILILLCYENTLVAIPFKRVLVLRRAWY